MPMGLLILSLTLIQDPDGLRLCEFACPIPTRKTLREMSSGMVSPPASAGRGNDFPKHQPAPSDTSSIHRPDSSVQDNLNFGETLKKTILNSISIKKANSADSPLPQILTVYFPYNSSNISQSDEMRIDQFFPDLAALASRDPDGKHFVKLVVTGYANAKGSKKYNENLAKRRARAVETILKKRAYGRLVIEAEVQSGSADSDKPDWKNRRAEIRVEAFEE
ncbi:MAG: OmpA family protein [Nitrospiria bacterium]